MTHIKVRTSILSPHVFKGTKERSHDVRFLIQVVSGRSGVASIEAGVIWEKTKDY